MSSMPLNLKKLENVQKQVSLQGLDLKREVSKRLRGDIIKAYKKLEKEYGENIDVAVRSSATAEDLQMLLLQVNTSLF